MKNHNLFIYLKIVMMMLCAIVGMGFISGAEIYQFFARFEIFSIFSIIIFFILMYLLSYKIIWKNRDIQNDVKMNNLNKNPSKNTFLNKVKIKSFLTNLNLLLVSSAMFAGLFSLTKNLFIHNCYLVGFFVCVIVFLILYFGVSILQKFDIIVICFVGFIFFHFLFDLIFNFSEIDFNQQSFGCLNMVKNCFGSVVFACLYVFMNIVQIQPIAHEFDGKLNSKHKWLAPLIFSISITILLSVFVCFMLEIYSLKNCEMPFFDYFKTQGGVMYFVYILGLILALLSSLLSCLIGVKRCVGKRIKSNFFTTGSSILLSMTISLIGFSNFVSIVYPIIGLINFIIFIFL